jgi:F-type H+-transporting ATPase subunit epsilon
MDSLKLIIVSQEQKLTEVMVSSITTMTQDGEITILPGHIPLFTRLKEGFLRYTSDKVEHTVVVSPGFLTIDPLGEVTVMVDSGVMARDASEEKAEQAIKAAEATLQDTTVDRRELIMAEASLKRAMLELQLARKTKKASIG